MTENKSNKSIAIVEKKVSKQEAEATALIIKDESTMEKAVTMLSEANKVSDALAIDKDKILDPAKAVVKEINDRYKPAETILKNVIATIRTKMMEYQKKVDAENKAKEQKLLDRVDRGTMKNETAARKVEELPQAAAPVTTSAGMVQWMIVKKLVIEDEKKIPREYLDINEVRIKAAIKEGKVVPGAKMIDEKVPKNFR